ncbi:FAD-dependent oxidoreductase [Bacillus cereus]|uniref:FAD-dependent oxidoreductase n=1 Tax=Bacillus cereus TaxID=1396 RepID=UPI0018F3A929|nr:FAD-dependent oxidoreductase [Bacillus cereus]MBJ7967621.1 NAD(P)-binding domain-containing protein [Bacillus cereus]MBJ8003964.1 NAD(P)-binding domain-containing protein [Bacillus cereus]
MKPIQLSFKVQECCGTENQTLQNNTDMQRIKQLPIAIIGGGPVGLAAAAHLAKHGESFILLEAGEKIGSNILTWGHVRLFSPWQYNIDKAALSLLEEIGWESSDIEALPTGKEIVEQYLQPIANLPKIKPFIHLNTKVLSIGRKDTDKMKTANREKMPFMIYTEKEGVIQVYEARAVLDASGTWGNPNPANSNGIWLKEEQSLKKHIFYGIPDILGKEQKRYANKRVAVVGSGHSAINALLELAKLKESNPKTEIVWIMRKQRAEEAYGGEKKDALEARGALGSKIHQLVDEGQVEVITPYKIQYVVGTKKGMDIVGHQEEQEIKINDVHEMIVNTGNRPNLSMISEIRTSIDSATESVGALAPLIDPNLHSCGTVRPHGEKELRQPEKDFYIVGAKSYGRAPTFLMATGYEQVRSIVAYLTGDYESAEKVELDLPETGVCSVNVRPNKVEDSCCGTDSCS